MWVLEGGGGEVLQKTKKLLHWAGAFVIVATICLSNMQEFGSLGDFLYYTLPARPIVGICGSCTNSKYQRIYADIRKKEH